MLNHVLPTTTEFDHVKEILDSNKLRDFKSDFTVQRSYRNGLGFPITIVDRDNIEYTISPNVAAGNITHSFTIVETISFSPNVVNINVESVLNAINSSPKAQAIKISLDNLMSLKATSHHISNNTTIIVEYTLSGNAFARRRHAVYLESLDLTICKKGYDYNVVHPYSAIGQSLIVKSSQNLDGFNYIVVINDPDEIYGQRYINIANRVFRVRITKDRSSRPGVYIYSKGTQINLKTLEENELAEFFEFGEADDKVPLFKTPSLAKDFGDAHLSRADEIKIKEAELKLAKADVDLEKTMLEGKLKTQEAEFKKEQLEQQMKMKQLEDELFREKLLRDRIQQDYKHKQDMASMDRKDVSDILKWVPSLITGILGIAGLVLQYKLKAAPG